jgi:hypothetical protein
VQLCGYGLGLFVAEVLQGDDNLTVLARVKPAVAVAAGRAVNDRVVLIAEIRTGTKVDEGYVIGEDLRPRATSTT